MKKIFLQLFLLLTLMLVGCSPDLKKVKADLEKQVASLQNQLQYLEFQRDKLVGGVSTVKDLLSRIEKTRKEKERLENEIKELKKPFLTRLFSFFIHFSFLLIIVLSVFVIIKNLEEIKSSILRWKDEWCRKNKYKKYLTDEEKEEIYPNYKKVIRLIEEVENYLQEFSLDDLSSLASLRNKIDKYVYLIYTKQLDGLSSQKPIIEKIKNRLDRIVSQLQKCHEKIEELMISQMDKDIVSNDFFIDELDEILKVLKGMGEDDK